MHRQKMVHEPAIGRMIIAQRSRMKQRPSGRDRWSAIRYVADKRMPLMSEMHTNLMPPAGVDAHPASRCIQSRQMRKRPYPGAAGFAPRIDIEKWACCVTQCFARFTDAALQMQGLCETTESKTLIAFFCALASQFFGRKAVLGNQHKLPDEPAQHRQGNHARRDGAETW